MHRRQYDIREMRCFILWAIDTADLELFDAAVRFLRHLINVADMQYGGSVYGMYQATLHATARILLERAESVNSHMIPLSLRYFANERGSEKAVWDTARAFAPELCDLVGRKPETCGKRCACT